jgi:signal peptidase I
MKKNLNLIFLAIIITIIIAILFLSGIFLIKINNYKNQKNYTNYNNFTNKTSFSNLRDQSLFANSLNKCKFTPIKLRVIGNSLAGFIASGTIVTVFPGYYNCNNPLRDDIVIYIHGNPNLPDPFLIKIIKGLPGDKISFKKSEQGAWNIFINNQILKTTNNIPYTLNEETYNIFSNYVNEANGVIPENHYLILGNLPSGSNDSINFGFIEKKDLLGKVISLE